MLKLHCSAVLSAIVALSLASCALAEDAVVADSASLNAAWNRAKPGDRILMAPGVYTGSVALSGGGGTLDRPIIIAAQDPLNPPVFDLGKKAINTFKASCFMLDGIVLKSTAVNAIQVIFGHHVVLKNFKAVDSGVGTGNSAVKFTGCNNFLMYNVTVTRWGLCGVDMVGDAKGLLMNNHLSNSTKPPHNACAFQAKGGSFDIGIFDNVVKDAGVRAIMMGGSTGAPFFHQGNIAKGWECYDSVAMGNKIVGGLWPISYSDANNIHFDYNTVVGPANGLLRILAESQPAPNPSSNGHYSHNLVQYGNVAECVNTSPNNVKPETFTFDGNYWFRTTNPAASKPRLPGKQINDAGEADPQLDASFNPQYEPAKAYGADAPGKDAAWLPHVNKFQWAWDAAESYLPHARPVVTHSGNDVILDGSSSTLGVNSYGSNTLKSYGWDLDNDGNVDLIATGPVRLTCAELAAIYGNKKGAHTIGLKVSVIDELGHVVWSKTEHAVVTVP